MFSRPGPDDLLEGVMVALQEHVLPECTSAKAQLSVVMAQALLQMARQVIPVQQQYMVEEANAYSAALRDMAKLLGDATGPEADRIRERAAGAGARPSLQQPPPWEEIVAAHDSVKQALVENVRDLDPLIRQGNLGAEQALLRMREVMGPFLARDFGTMVIGAGMAGRG